MQIKDFEIIDFHAHPFEHAKNNICRYPEICNMSKESTIEAYKNFGISRICGSVISQIKDDDVWGEILNLNDQALKLAQEYGNFYYPGFHVHPNYVEESIAQIDRFSALGYKLMGELVPYMMGGYAYADERLTPVFDHAEKKGIVVNIHPIDDDDIDAFVKRHKNLIVVGAHPNNDQRFFRHLERLKKYDNYYIDMAAAGTLSYGMLKKVIDTVGAERILFGTDYPICHPGAHVGAVLFDSLIKDSEKELIFSKNAKRLLNL